MAELILLASLLSQFFFAGTIHIPSHKDHRSLELARRSSNSYQSYMPACNNSNKGLLKMLSHNTAQLIRSGMFTCVTCNNSILSDETQFASAQWQAADGNNAWKSMKAWWLTIRGEQDPLGAVSGFVSSISYAWNGPTQWDCTDIGETYCSSVVTCQQTNIPAGSMVLTAFSNIHQFYDNMYTGMQNASDSMGHQLAEFSSTFAPQNTATVDALKLLLDLFGISYGILGAGIWNRWIKEGVEFKNANNHGWLKDAANAAITSTIVLAKDSQNGVQGQVDTLNDINLILGHIIDGWSSVTEQYSTKLFSGSDDGLTQLDAYIDGGGWYDTNGIHKISDLSTNMENVLYGGLIPLAWTDHREVHPVVIFQEQDNVTNPNSALPDPPSPLNDQEAVKFRSIYSRYTLWLLDAHDCHKVPKGKNNPGGCDKPYVQPLPGADQLIPGNAWGGVLIDDINISAWLGYILNGMQNGYAMPDDSLFIGVTPNADFPFQAGIRTPGFFSSIPVCNMTTVARNVNKWRHSDANKRTAHYPCSP